MDRPWIDAGLKYAAISERDLPCLLLQRTARLRCGQNLDNQFLRYLVGSPEFTRHIQSITTGSLVPHISSRQIKDFAFVRPPIAKQRRIAAVLGSLDAKIELNQRINAELEGMAKLLYDYWFVQFDFPMTAAQATALGKPKLAGHPYRASGGKMIYNELLKRDIPEGWKIKPLSEIVNVTKETVNPSDEPAMSFKLFSIPVFDKTGSYSVDLGADIGSHKFVVTGNDILVSKLNPWTSRVIYTDAEIEAVCSTEFVVWQATSSWQKAYLYMLARSPQFIAHCSQSASGTSNSHKRVNPNVMMSHVAPWDTSVVQAFGDRVNSMLLARQVNQTQNQELIQLRDWLLPMLMNGQVTVG